MGVNIRLNKKNTFKYEIKNDSNIINLPKFK